jgi:hypothetical protein
MKFRKYSLLLLAILLFFSVTISVEASPSHQDPQDALIRQVLTVTAAKPLFSMPDSLIKTCYFIKGSAL